MSRDLEAPYAAAGSVSMPKVFYSENPNSSPPGDREWAEGGSGSEAETELENAELRKVLPKRKLTHRRTETMDVDAELQVSHKRAKSAGNAVIRQRQTSREVRDATGQRPLQKACSRSDLIRVKDLLANLPDLQDRDYAGTTALHTAALQGDAAIVRVLLEAGAVPDVRSGPEELDTPLMDATANGFLSIVEMLLAAGADPRVTNARGRIAEDFVDKDQDESEAIQKALQIKTNELRRKGVPCINSPNDKDAPSGLFPLEFAGIQRPAAPVFLDVLKRSFRQEIVEHASTGDFKYVGLALERGWQPTAEALVKAAKFGHSEIVGLLLAFGLTADAKFEGTSALNEAIKRSHLEIVKLLIDGGASLKPYHRKLVADLPDRDELRALVMGVSPTPNLLTATEAKISCNKPHEERLKRPKEEGSSDFAVETQINAKVRSEPIKRELEGFEEKLKIKQNLAADAQFSKISLRSIKPKKRSKPSTNVSCSKDEGLLDIGTSVVKTEHPTLEEPSPPQPAQNSLDPAEHTPHANSEEPTEDTKLPDSDILDSNESPLSSSASTSSSPALAEETGQRRSVSREQSQEPSSRRSSRNASMSGEIWEERSQVWSQLEQLRAKQRRDREVRMLESLAQEQRRRSGSQIQTDGAVDTSTVSASPLKHPHLISLKEAETEGNTVLKDNCPHVPQSEAAERVVNKTHRMENSSKAEKADSPSFSPLHSMPQTPEADKNSESTDKQKPVSVARLPWVLRQLAYTGKPLPVAPLLVHTIVGVGYYFDLQVSVAFGVPLLHLNFPKLVKVPVTSRQQKTLWSFCSSWLCRPGATADEIADDCQKFLQLPLSWILVSEIEENFAASSAEGVSSIPVELELKFHIRSQNRSGAPLKWVRRAEIASSVW